MSSSFTLKTTTNNNNNNNNDSLTTRTRKRSIKEYQKVSLLEAQGIPRYGGNHPTEETSASRKEFLEKNINPCMIFGIFIIVLSLVFTIVGGLNIRGFITHTTEILNPPQGTNAYAAEKAFKEAMPHKAIVSYFNVFITYNGKYPSHDSGTSLNPCDNITQIPTLCDFLSGVSADLAKDPKTMHYFQHMGDQCLLRDVHMYKIADHLISPQNNSVTAPIISNVSRFDKASKTFGEGVQAIVNSNMPKLLNATKFMEANWTGGGVKIPTEADFVVGINGLATFLASIAETSRKDLIAAMSVVLPVMFVLVLLRFRCSLTLTLVSFYAAGGHFCASLGVMRPVDNVMNVSSPTPLLMFCLGIGISIVFSLLVVTEFTRRVRNYFDPLFRGENIVDNNNTTSSGKKNNNNIQARNSDSHQQQQQKQQQQQQQQEPEEEEEEEENDGDTSQEKKKNRERDYIQEPPSFGMPSALRDEKIPHLPAEFDDAIFQENFEHARCDIIVDVIFSATGAITVATITLLASLLMTVFFPASIIQSLGIGTMMTCVAAWFYSVVVNIALLFVGFNFFAQCAYPSALWNSIATWVDHNVYLPASCRPGGKCCCNFGKDRFTTFDYVSPTYSEARISSPSPDSNSPNASERQPLLISESKKQQQQQQQQNNRSLTSPKNTSRGSNNNNKANFSSTSSPSVAPVAPPPSSVGSVDSNSKHFHDWSFVDTKHHQQQQSTTSPTLSSSKVKNSSTSSNNTTSNDNVVVSVTSLTGYGSEQQQHNNNDSNAIGNVNVTDSNIVDVNYQEYQQQQEEERKQKQQQHQNELTCFEKVWQRRYIVRFFIILTIMAVQLFATTKIELSNSYLAYLGRDAGATKDYKDFTGSYGFGMVSPYRILIRLTPEAISKHNITSVFNKKFWHQAQQKLVMRVLQDPILGPQTHMAGPLVIGPDLQTLKDIEWCWLYCKDKSIYAFVLSQVASDEKSMYLMMTAKYNPLGKEGWDMYQRILSLTNPTTDNNSSSSNSEPIYFTTDVEGDGPSSLDCVHAIYNRVPYLAPIAVISATVVFFLVFRSFLNSLRFLIGLTATLSATLIFPMVVYQHGVLEWTHITELEKIGDMPWIAPIITFSVALGLACCFDALWVMSYQHHQTDSDTTSNIMKRKNNKKSQQQQPQQEKLSSSRKWSLYFLGLLVFVANLGLSFSQVPLMNATGVALCTATVFASVIVPTGITSPAFEHYEEYLEKY